MKKVFAIIALLAVSLMFLTACSSIVLLNESLKYEMFYESLKATFYVDIGNDEVEYIDYDLNIYGRDKELLHKEHYEKVELYKGDNGKYYVKDFYCYYPDELVNNQDKIAEVTVTNIKPWSYSMPVLLFVFVAIASVATTIAMIAVAVKRKPVASNEEEATDNESDTGDSAAPSDTQDKE